MSNIIVNKNKGIIINDIDKYVDNKVEKFFTEIADEFELQSGGVSGYQHNKIEQFKEVVKEYIKQNN